MTTNHVDHLFGIWARRLGDIYFSFLEAAPSRISPAPTSTSLAHASNHFQRVTYVQKVLTAARHLHSSLRNDSGRQLYRYFPPTSLSFRRNDSKLAAQIELRSYLHRAWLDLVLSLPVVRRPYFPPARSTTQRTKLLLRKRTTYDIDYLVGTRARRLADVYFSLLGAAPSRISHLTRSAPYQTPRLFGIVLKVYRTALYDDELASRAMPSSSTRVLPLFAHQPIEPGKMTSISP